MNVIFLTMSRVWDINQRGIYSDLMRMFCMEGHNVFIVTPFERSVKKATALIKQNGASILGVKTLNLQKTNVVEKGVGQVLVERQYKNAIMKYLSSINFDLILYSTPPITFPNVISFLKKRNPNAKTYLLLKDIFPQNAVDIGMMTKTGLKGMLYRYFRTKEKRLYSLSDFIGCMSPANVDYVLKNNPEISAYRVEVAPNSVELREEDVPFEDEEIKSVRERYGLPPEKLIFIYGGNLGKPQGIPFLIEVLNANVNRNDCFFVIIGNGTEYGKLSDWYHKEIGRNVMLMDRLPKQDYDNLVKACDVGLIFLDHRFSIPNYPSRLLSYLENKMPVLFATDPNTDIGRIAEENGYGYWCESNSVEAFTGILDKMIHSDIKDMGEKGYAYLLDNYLVEKTYNTIISHV